MEIGVQGFGPRDRQHDGGEGEEGDRKLTEQEPEAYVGDRAARICGCPRMPATPQAPMAVNHTTITGPKRRPTRAVPNRWAANSTTMITAVMGMTSGSSSGSTTSRPSTDDRTEIAGVIMLSPKKREAPKTPRAASSSLVRAFPASAGA